jgi:hypothetical protein
MKLKDLLNEEKKEKIGHRRLVSSIMSMVKNGKGKYPSRVRVSNALKKIDKDKAFLKRIKKRAKQLQSDGYYWNAIRRRVASSL